MKYKIILLILLINKFTFFAHSGNTDSKGGHYNTKTGEYHYHNHDNNNFVLFIILFIGLACFYFLYVISQNPTKTKILSNTNSKISVLTPEQKRFHYEIDRQRREREAKQFRKNTGGCLIKIIAFIVTIICTVSIPDGWGFLVVIIFILFISWT